MLSRNNTERMALRALVLTEFQDLGKFTDCFVVDFGRIDTFDLISSSEYLVIIKVFHK